MREDAKNEYYLPNLPPVPDGCKIIVDYLQDVGPALDGSMGPVKLTYLEIRAWRRELGLVLTPWEVRTLHRLSREYVSAYAAGAKDNAEAPWIDPTSDEWRVHVLPNKIRQLLRA